MQSGDLGLQLSTVPQARRKTDQQGNQNATHGPSSLSTQVDKFHVFNVDEIFGRDSLQLQGCDRVDDEAIKVLAGFPSLKELDLRGSGVSETGIASLRAVKPDMRIHWGPWEAAAAAFRNN